MVKRLREPLAAELLPFNLDVAEPLADGVEHIDDQIFPAVLLGDVLRQPGRIRLLCRCGIGRRRDFVRNGQQCALALLHLGKQMGVPFFHIGEQVGLGLQVAQLGLVENLLQALGRQPLAGVLGIQAGQCGHMRGLRLAQHIAADRFPVDIDNLNHFFHHKPRPP